MVEAGGLGAGAIALARGIAVDPVEAQAGQQAGAPEFGLVLHEHAGGAQAAVLEGVVAQIGVEQRRVIVDVALGAGAHAPAFGADRQQVAFAERELVAGAQAMGHEADVVADVVAREVGREGADLPEDFLAPDVGRQLAGAEPGIEAEFGELAALLGRMHRDPAERGRQAGAAGLAPGAGRARIPDVVVGVALQVHAQAHVVGQPVAVLGQQRVRAVAGERLAAERAVVVAGAPGRGADHQRVAGAAVAQQQRTRQATLGAAHAQREAAAALRIFAEPRLRRDQVHHAAQCAGAVQHRSGPLHGLDPFEQADVEHRRDRPLRLGRVHPKAVDEDDDTLLLQAAQDRVLAPGTVRMDRQAGFAAQRFAGRSAGGRVHVDAFDGERGFLRVRIAAGGGHHHGVERRLGVRGERKQADGPSNTAAARAGGSASRARRGLWVMIGRGPEEIKMAMT